MELKSEIFLILVTLTNFFLLGSSRLISYVRAVAIQTLFLGFLTVSIHQNHLSIRILAVIAINIVLKSIFFPWLILRTIEQIDIKREVEPIINYAFSIFIGVFTLGGILFLVYRLPPPTTSFSPLIVSVAFFTVLVGFFLIVSRNKAITQVIGYLIIENGIYLFGVTFMQEAPLFVELGVLLDLFVGIFIMQIIMHHIRREFDSLNVKHLSNLKDWQA